jgi:hypothetical protein
MINPDREIQKKGLSFPSILKAIVMTAVAAGMMTVFFGAYHWFAENRILRQVIERLTSDSRIAEVLVTKSEYDETTKKIKTTIKFLEYDAKGKPLEPRYFTFQGNIIQFQSLVIRFEDDWVKKGDKLRGKSVYLFMKAFVLDGSQTQVFDITPINEIPGGYKVPGPASKFEIKLWQNFWNYVFDPRARRFDGVKNAQVEAPGSMFLPGTIYTIKIEHDGGMRIDTRPVPEILKGETV